MATVMNDPVSRSSASDSASADTGASTGVILGVLLVLILGALFIIYAVPALRGSAEQAQQAPAAIIETQPQPGIGGTGQDL